MKKLLMILVVVCGLIVTGCSQMQPEKITSKITALMLSLIMMLGCIPNIANAETVKSLDNFAKVFKDLTQSNLKNAVKMSLL